MSEGFCTNCSAVIESFEGLTRCPFCGDNGVPCSNANQVNVSVNIHELRVLCIWAENYERTLTDPKGTVYAIARRLKKQLRPDVVLTMRDEFQAMRDIGIKFETDHPAADADKEPQEN